MTTLAGKVALVTGAGRGMGRVIALRLAALDKRAVEAMVSVSLLGPLYVASEAASRLKSGGRIVNISSSLAKFPRAGSSVVAFLCSPEASWVSGAHILANCAANT